MDAEYNKKTLPENKLYEKISLDNLRVNFFISYFNICAFIDLHYTSTDYTSHIQNKHSHFFAIYLVTFSLFYEMLRAAYVNTNRRKCVRFSFEQNEHVTSRTLKMFNEK